MKSKNFTLILLLVAGMVNAQTLEWASSIGSNYTDRALCVIIDNQGNKYIGGQFNDTVDFDLGAGSAIAISKPDAIGRGSAYVLKLDANDNFVKVLTFGNPASPNYVGVSAMGKDASGNLFLSGYYSNTTDFNPDTAVTNNLTATASNNIFLVKLDANESFLWAKQWKNNYAEGEFNGTKEEGVAMAIDADGNVLLTSRFKGTVDFDPDTSSYNITSNGQQGYVMKLDNNGKFLWTKILVADTSAGTLVYPRSISADASGNLYISGDFIGTIDFNPDSTASNNLTSSFQSGFLLKLAPNGSYQWAKKMGNLDSSPISSFNFANAVTVDGASNIVLAGSFMGSVSMGSTTLVSNGYSDIFIAKLDASGNYLWAKSIGNTWDSDKATRMTVDAANNIYVAGIFRGNLDFNPGANSNLISSNGGEDAFLLKLNTNGGFEWAKTFGGAGSDELIYGVAAKDNSVLAVGGFTVQMSCDNEGSYYINAAYLGSGTERHDGWVAKINQGATGIEDVTTNFQFTLYPNPASSTFTIELPHYSSGDAKLTMFDIHGKRVNEVDLTEPITNVSLDGLSKGMYFARVANGSSYAVKNFVVE